LDGAILLKGGGAAKREILPAHGAQGDFVSFDLQKLRVIRALIVLGGLLISSRCVSMSWRT
jgi:hypothetical protein